MTSIPRSIRRPIFASTSKASHWGAIGGGSHFEAHEQQPQRPHTMQQAAIAMTRNTQLTAVSRTPWSGIGGNVGLVPLILGWLSGPQPSQMENGCLVDAAAMPFSSSAPGGAPRKAKIEAK